MQIEKDIPLKAADYSNSGAPPKYPFAKMQIGDSIFFLGQSTKYGRAYSAAMAWSRNHPVKFIGRSVDDGLRIWRIA